MTMTLLGLAAGMGSRFGGPKQLAPLGPNGETLLDFAVYDALHAGFDAVTLVIRAELRDAFEQGLVARWRPRVPVTLIEQRVDGRAKPWGTGHAVLAAAPALGERFAVVNGDDFYGRSAYERLAEFLRAVDAGEPSYAVMGYPLGATLTASGGVNRGVLDVAANGRLVAIEEVRDIRIGESGDAVVQGDDDTARAIPATTLVSMNTWGFTRAVLPQLADRFADFQRAHADDPSAEFFIPTEIDALVQARRARVTVLTGSGPWIGMTYPADRPGAVSAIAELVARGDYPSPVWR